MSNGVEGKSSSHHAIIETNSCVRKCSLSSSPSPWERLQQELGDADKILKDVCIIYHIAKINY